MYNQDEKALIWLNNFNNISTKKKLLILDLFMSPSEMYTSFKSCREDISQIIDTKVYNQLALLCEDSYVDKIINDLKVKNVKTLTIASENYPNKLKDDLLDPPICLYYKGNIELLLEQERLRDTAKMLRKNSAESWH